MKAKAKEQDRPDFLAKLQLSYPLGEVNPNMCRCIAPSEGGALLARLRGPKRGPAGFALQGKRALNCCYIGHLAAMKVTAV
jgi:hypothetical protein